MTAAAPVGQDAAVTLTIPTRLFGPLEVPADHCITFAEGLLGFAGLKRFVLLPSAAEGLFWLQSVEESGLVFLTMDPYRVVPDYEAVLPDRGVRGHLIALAIVTLPKGEGQGCTLNLQGPLCIDLDHRTGWQVVQPGGRWQVRHPVDLQPFLAAVDSSRAPGGR
jgi:flagellar assembly factor FliW